MSGHFTTLILRYYFLKTTTTTIKLEFLGIKSREWEFSLFKFEPQKQELYNELSYYYVNM